MSEIELVPGADGDPETGDGWRPRLALDHEGNELFVIVGEEVTGMAEGVSPETYALLRQRMGTA